MKVQGEGEGALGQFAVHHPVERPHSLLDARGTGDQQRPGAGFFVEVFEEQERQPTEVISVEVTNRHKVHLLGREAEGFERQQSGGAAVEQKACASHLDKVATLTPAAVAERIARAENRNTHRCSRAWENSLHYFLF